MLSFVRQDSLQIHDGDGPLPGVNVLGKFCGNELPKNGTFQSTHHVIYMWFRMLHPRPGKGFSLSWESIDPVCGTTLNATSGTITSPGYPGKYPLKRDCYWYVTTAPGRIITFYFANLQIENYSDCNHDTLTVNSGHAENHNEVIDH
jgi:cubilin